MPLFLQTSGYATKYLFYEKPFSYKLNVFIACSFDNQVNELNANIFKSN